jgi:hypothetical protein
MLSSTALPALAGWESFYVITGSSSAGLIGLMFVVVTLASGNARVHGTEGLSAFATPSVVHFAAVLLIAALLSMPGQTPVSLTVCLSAAATLGLLYSVRVIARALRQRGYEPEWLDWVWYILLPTAAYLTLLVATATLRRHPTFALYLVGGVDLGLLFIGMHNAWDTAVWVSTHPRDDDTPTSPNDPER